MTTYNRAKCKVFERICHFWCQHKTEPTKSWKAFWCDYCLDDDDVLRKRFDNLPRGIFKIKSNIYDGSFRMLHLKCSIRCIWLISKYTLAFLNLLLYNVLKIATEKQALKIFSLHKVHLRIGSVNMPQVWLLIFLFNQNEFILKKNAFSLCYLFWWYQNMFLFNQNEFIYLKEIFFIICFFPIQTRYFLLHEFFIHYCSGEYIWSSIGI